MRDQFHHHNTDMARKPSLSIEALVALDPEKLAQLVLDEAGRSPSFRRLANAALAGAQGPDAVAKLIDRRLAALEKARGFIEWDKVRAFRGDLHATVTTIVGELAQGSVVMAIDRLLRFIATHEAVFERADDSSGHVQGVYYDAIEAMGHLAAKLPTDEAALLPEKIMAALGASSHGYLIDVADAVAIHLPEEVLKRWDQDIRARQLELGKSSSSSSGRSSDYRMSQLGEVRQAIAKARSDLDSLIAIEETKHPNLQDTIGIAESLLEAGRLDEALDWIRKRPQRLLRHMSAEDLADSLEIRDPQANRQASVEAAILMAMGDREAAQKLRWTVFEHALSPEILREYLGALPDFEEFEALDRAFAYASASSSRYHALSLFMEWPRLDLAADLIVRKHDQWDGRQYYFLPPIAQALEHEYPLAATVIYRALINDILTKARSKAYGHGARYLARLSALTQNMDTAQSDSINIADHPTYAQTLRERHGRKTGFWSLVKAQ